MKILKVLATFIPTLLVVGLIIYVINKKDTLVEVRVSPLSCQKVVSATCDSRETIMNRCRAELDDGRKIGLYDLVLPGETVCPRLEWSRKNF